MKPILKSLQIAILCGSVLNLQSIALAQDLDAHIRTTAQTSSASSTSASAGTGTTIAAIKNDAGMMSSITMIAIGFIATQLFKYKKTADILLALGGGVAFIGGEIMTTNSFKEIAKDLEVPSGNPSAAQIEALQKLKKSYEETNKTLKTKKMLQLAAAGAFGIAGITAVMLKSKEVVAEQKEKTAILAAATQAQAGAAQAAAACPTSPAECNAVAPLKAAAVKLTKLAAEKEKINIQAELPTKPSVVAAAEAKKNDSYIQNALIGVVATLNSGLAKAAEYKVKANNLYIKGKEEVEKKIAQAAAKGTDLLDGATEQVQALVAQGQQKAAEVGARAEEFAKDFAAEAKSMAGAAGAAVTEASVTALQTAKGVVNAVESSAAVTKLKEVHTTAYNYVGSFLSSSIIVKKNQLIVKNHTTIKDINNASTGKLESFIKHFYQFVVPTASAGTMELLMGGAGVGLGMLVKLLPGLGEKIDLFLNKPKNRAIIWGVLAGLSFAASAATSKTMEQVDENIKKIDGVLKGVNSTNASSTPTTSWFLPFFSLISFANATTELPNKIESPTLRLSGNRKMSCLDKAGDKNCKSIKSQALKMPMFKSLSPSILPFAMDVLNIADGFNGVNSISESTLASANNLATSQPAIANSFSDSKKNLNALLAKKGRPQINFAKENESFLNSLNNKVAKILNENNMKPSQFLATINPSVMKQAMQYQETESSMSDAVAEVAIASKVESNNENDDMAATSNVNKVSDLDNSFHSYESAENSARLEDKTNGKGKYIIGDNDIITDKKLSIFDIISSRYLKSIKKLQEE